MYTVRWRDDRRRERRRAEVKDGKKKKEVTFDRNSMLRAEKINDDVARRIFQNEAKDKNKEDRVN